MGNKTISQGVDDQIYGIKRPLTNDVLSSEDETLARANGVSTDSGSFQGGVVQPMNYLLSGRWFNNN